MMEVIMDILIVEDEEAIAELMKISLQQAGYSCECVLDGEKAAEYIEHTIYDLILLDIMLPGIDGYTLMEYIEPMHIPVIFITAKGSIKDRVKGLHMGADDYLVKPFDIDELLARVESVLRRYHKGRTRIEIQGVLIDTNLHKVLRENREVALTKLEYDLLVELARNQNIVLYRDTLYRKVWGDDLEGESRTLDLHIQRLRKKLHWSSVIKTIYRIGYCLENNYEVR